MDNCKKELICIQNSLKRICKTDKMGSTNEEKIITAFPGKDSSFYIILTSRLKLLPIEFNFFMARLCLLSLLRHGSSTVSKLERSLEINLQGVIRESMFNFTYSNMTCVTMITNNRASSR